MKNIISVFFIIIIFSDTTFAQDAKVVSDCTVNFDVSVQDKQADQQIIKSLSGATEVLYIKGSKSRTDLITPAFKQTMITDTKSDTAIILREIGNAKYLSYLYGNKRIEQNRRYLGIQFTKTDERKTILGYECNRVIAKLADSTSYNIFYTTDIKPSNLDYEYQFKDIPGLVLEYEAQSLDGKAKIKYVAFKISFLPVPGAMFDIPKSGFRVL